MPKAGLKLVSPPAAVLSFVAPFPSPFLALSALANRLHPFTLAGSRFSTPRDPRIASRSSFDAVGNGEGQGPRFAPRRAPAGRRGPPMRQEASQRRRRTSGPARPRMRPGPAAVSGRPTPKPGPWPPQKRKQAGKDSPAGLQRLAWMDSRLRSSRPTFRTTSISSGTGCRQEATFLRRCGGSRFQKRMEGRGRWAFRRLPTASRRKSSGGTRFGNAQATVPGPQARSIALSSGCGFAAWTTSATMSSAWSSGATAKPTACRLNWSRIARSWASAFSGVIGRSDREN
jgi:hypothetical protein